MSKKEFETAAIIVLGLSLIYVPTKVCEHDLCMSDGWFFITELAGSFSQLDFTIFIIQEFVIGLLLFAIWNFMFKK